MHDSSNAQWHRSIEEKEKEKVDMCNYCHEFGHWKNECLLLKAKADNSKVKSTLAFMPFITKGAVRMVESTQTVPVKILRDTGSEETFVLESVLPFSPASYTGSNVLIKGIGLNVMSVPLHKIVLQSVLVQGEVEVAVRSCLPVEGVQVILGNDLAGDRVWRNDSPHLVVTPCPMILKSDGDDSLTCPSSVLPSCVITRSMSKSQAEVKPGSEKVVSESLEIP